MASELIRLDPDFKFLNFMAPCKQLLLKFHLTQCGLEMQFPGKQDIVLPLIDTENLLFLSFELATFVNITDFQL